MERTGSQEDLIFGIPGSGRWSDWRSWSTRRKCFVASSIIMSVAVLTAVIILVATYSTASTVIPTPSPTTLPTSTTTPATTTTTPTTTTTTTPPTTTSTTTTTTAPTTTTTAPTTTTTTAPTTTTSSTTTTTAPTTTTSSTTTTTATTTTTTVPTTLAPGPFHPSTKNPLPKDWETKAPWNLLTQEGLNPTTTEIFCTNGNPPVFRIGVTIADPTANHTWFADGTRKRYATTSAARLAVEAIFDVTYKIPGPEPPTIPCKPINSTEITDI